MNWTLLVPGALLPPALAPELIRAMRAPVLAAQLAPARELPAPAPGASSAEAPTQSPHWQWLARHWGLEPSRLATAPYAWRSAMQGARQAPSNRAGGADDDGTWVAHCDPVHMSIARDHFVVTDLAAQPLTAPESAELLDLANGVLAAEPPASGVAVGPRLRIAIRDGGWFLLSPRPLALTTWSLDAVLGQSVQDRVPTGPDARRWRVLSNEIQMSWHASRTSADREESGARAPNALWLHGGGVWQPLPAAAPLDLRADEAPLEARVIRGWMAAANAGGEAATGTAVRRPVGTLSVCRVLSGAHAHQAWESWLEQLPVLEARIAAEMAAARSAGAARFDLVLCGARTTRTASLALEPSWWRRLLAGTPAPARTLQRWLTEAALSAHTDRAGDGALAA